MSTNNERIEQLYKDAAQNIEKAKAFLEKTGEITDKDKEEADRFQREAGDYIKEAKRLQGILDAEIDLRKYESEKEQKAHRPGASKTGEAQFENGGLYMKALWESCTGGAFDPRVDALRRSNVKTLSGETGISGGFLIPTQQSNEILKVMGETSFVRQHATIVPMGSRVVEWPAFDYSTGSAGVNAFTAGVRVYWTEEGNAPTATDLKFKKINLHARELKGLAYVPNATLRDSPQSLQVWYSGDQGFGGAIGAETDYKAINGTGAGSPLGLLNSPAKLAVTRSASTTFKFVDAVKMLSSALMTGKPRWAINQSVMPQLLQFVDAGNNSLFTINAALAPQGTLLGLPIDWNGKNPPLGTAGDVMLVDWSMYLIGDRQIFLMEVDTSYKFGEDLTTFKASTAFDGQPWLNSVITLMDGATTVSPYVVLT